MIRLDLAHERARAAHLATGQTIACGPLDLSAFSYERIVKNEPLLEHAII